MPVEFLNENLFTDFPFLNGKQISTRIVVDARAIMYSNYSLQNRIYLKSYVGDGSTITITIGEEGSGRDFDFVIEQSTKKYEKLESIKDFGHMFIVVGEPLDEDFTQTFSFNSDENILVPTRVINVSQNRVTKIRVANKYNAQYVNEYCDIYYIDPEEEYKASDTEFTEKVNMDWGRFYTHEFQETGNSIVFSLDNSDSLIKNNAIHEYRVLPESYDINTEPQCSEAVFTINGAEPDESNNIDINGSGSMRVVVDDEPHTINMVFLEQIVNKREVPTRKCIYVLETTHGIIPLKNNMQKHMLEGDTWVKLSNSGCYKVRCLENSDTFARSEIRVLVRSVHPDLASCQDCEENE